ncbi:unnamed protein product [Arabidopsis thaliana]|uniref:Uncharacterized protein n=1 Tax=Arabidopsis thaliana TaxID=3702 RepID=A0A5S9WY29_ARATH|nr:unnamed protein product [Arabidopsis thaliana]
MSKTQSPSFLVKPQYHGLAETYKRKERIPPDKKEKITTPRVPRANNPTQIQERKRWKLWKSKR